MSQSKFSVLVFGLDGATFDLMLPWIEQGHFPCLGRLIHQGAWSRLCSTIPPITPCAWSSFMTGKNPGKHGLFDFVEPTPTGRGFRFTNGSCRHAESLWAYLSRQGRRVGVLNVPMTYPPEPVNGFLISGLDTPGEHSEYTFPANLRTELNGHGICYRIDPRHLGNMRTDTRRDQILAELCAIETVRTQALQYLSRRYVADFRMLVYTATDQVQHHFWHYMDSQHDKYDSTGAERYRHAIRDVYAHIDRLIESLLQEEKDDTVVILMSDHGFGRTSNVRLRLNQAFEKEGLLTFAKESTFGRSVRSGAGALDSLLRSTLSASAKRLLAQVAPRLRIWFENLDEAGVDWDRTSVLTNEVSRCFPTVWLTPLQGRENSADRAHALDAAIKALRGLRDPQTGQPAISNVYRAHDLYWGPHVDRAPDLIPSWWEDRFLLEQSVPGGPPEMIVERSMTPVQGGVEFSGSHRMDGIFVMAGGPTLRGHDFSGANIIDVAPTILYLMGVPVPSDMDGRPLLEALDPDYVTRNPIRSDGEPVRRGRIPADETGYSEAESEMVKTRLQSMGYID
jgi:predicted AlkP superfamily phosphohydrolase/phosphomutase